VVSSSESGDKPRRYERNGNESRKRRL
jgi:hypothetical protein